MPDGKTNGGDFAIRYVVARLLAVEPDFRIYQSSTGKKIQFLSCKDRGGDWFWKKLPFLLCPPLLAY
ncbi:MAG: hypothetical protein WDM76_01630 [Limisphaerales bacterium]